MTTQPLPGVVLRLDRESRRRVMQAYKEWVVERYDAWVGDNTAEAIAESLGADALVKKPRGQEYLLLLEQRTMEQWYELYAKFPDMARIEAMDFAKLTLKYRVPRPLVPEMT